MPISDKRNMSEEEVKFHYFTPALVAGGRQDQITMENRVKFTAGRVNIRGNIVRCDAPKRADYVLYNGANCPNAVVEVKDNSHTVSYGLQQAMDYAVMLDFPFAYSSNGDVFVEHDFLTGVEREIPLPSVKGQKRIVKRIDGLLDLVQQLQLLKTEET